MLAPLPDAAPLFGGLAAGYRPPHPERDEMLAADGSVRPHWRAFLERLGALSASEREARWSEARDLVHDNGVSYNVYGDPRGLERPWSLSPVPVLLPADDFAPLAAGVAERARLLDWLLADLYGAQRSLREGWLPAELVFRHPGYLRPLQGVAAPLGRWLPLYGVDVARGPDRRWAVLADRTQAPSGAGYALENRIVVSRTLPDLFRASNVERLALFFRGLQETLNALAPAGRSRPRVVLLTPGPYNATYFEQAYLAQYLGYTLASGGDLVARDGRVFLKTLSGLQPVDVIFRRVNDDYCDPLELRAESVLGVPGLLESVRQGGVVVANPLGSGLTQTPALLPYLPRIARHVFGNELGLRAVETFWCGDRSVFAQVMDRLPTLVIKPAYSDALMHPVFVSRLASAEREALRARIEADPGAWVAQEELAVSTTPSLAGEDLAPRTLILRSFAVTGAGDPVVMPGALARVAGGGDHPEVSMQTGAGSQDAWVLASGPVSPFTLLPSPTAAVALSRGTGDLPSRAADNLFWLGRYAERAESVARICRVVAGLLQQSPAQAAGGTVESVPLLRALCRLTDIAPAAAQVGPLAEAERMLAAAVFDRQSGGSLASVIRRTMDTARLVRERLSADSWRVLAALDDDLGGAGGDEVTAGPALGGLSTLLDRTVVTLAAFSGIAQESMTRGHAWRFLDLGRRLERAMTLLRFLRYTLVEPAQREAALMEAVLEVADSGITYRRRYLTALQAGALLDLLMTDDTNPRSLVFQLRALVDHLAALPPSPVGATAPEREVAEAVLRTVQAIDVEALARQDDSGQRAALEELLGRLASDLRGLSDSLASGYLNHATVSRHLGADGFPARPRRPATS